MRLYGNFTVVQTAQGSDVSVTVDEGDGEEDDVDPDTEVEVDQVTVDKSKENKRETMSTEKNRISTKKHNS